MTALDQAITAGQRVLLGQLAQRLSDGVRQAYPDARALWVTFHRDLGMFEPTAITGVYGKKLWTLHSGENRLWRVLLDAGSTIAYDVAEDAALWGELALRLDLRIARNGDRIIRFSSTD